MADKGFDQPRPAEPRQIPPQGHSFKTGSLVFVKGQNGEVEDWAVHSFDTETRLFRLVRLAEVNGEKGFIQRFDSFQRLSELNDPTDPFRIGALVSLQRSDGRVEDDWTSKGKDPKTGRYVLEKPDGHGGILRKNLTEEALRQLNS